MLRALRQRVLNRLFGAGFGAFVAATGAGWLIDQIRGAFSDEGERLDTTKLRAGESYVVTTRPPMSRAERRLAEKRDRLDARITAASRPSRSTVRLARRYRRVGGDGGTTTGGGRQGLRQGRRATKADRLGATLDRRLQPSDKAARLIEERRAMDSDLARHAERARAAAKPPRRPSTPRVFR